MENNQSTKMFSRAGKHCYMKNIFLKKGDEVIENKKKVYFMDNVSNNESNKKLYLPFPGINNNILR